MITDLSKSSFSASPRGKLAGMVLAPVTHPGLLTDSVFDMIHTAITSGDLPAGTQLKVRDVAAEVGTSVMPVREAIRRLEDIGLVSHEPHKGAVVKYPTMAELVQTYEVRTLLEVEAARRGAPAATDEDCFAMWQLEHRLARAVDDGHVLDALNLDEQILGILYGAAGNAVLVDSIRALWRQCRAYKVRGARSDRSATPRGLWSFQPRIVAAAHNRDGRAAADIVAESLRSAMNRIAPTLTADD